MLLKIMRQDGRTADCPADSDDKHTHPVLIGEQQDLSPVRPRASFEGPNPLVA
jgi:hypothetical protein